MNTAKLSGNLPATAYKYMLEVVDRYKITAPLRLSHFLSQIAHESGNFQFVTENLNYSTDSLLRVFPKYFKDRATAESYARNQEKIGSRVYGGRMGNGAEATLEGFKFRGRGYLQLTGKENYRLFSEFIKEDCVANPDLVATKYPMDSAIWFFDRNKLWSICDKGSSDAVVTELTKRINGGTHGLQDRLSKFKTYFSLIS
jgi:putative chitinase